MRFCVTNGASGAAKFELALERSDEPNYARGLRTNEIRPVARRSGTSLEECVTRGYTVEAECVCVYVC